MALTQLAPPYPVFTDKNGDPLDNGYLYFGEVNKNPETNPIQVYYDRNFTQPVAQPLRTSNGYVMRNGSPALIYAGENASVTVRDKDGSLVIYSPAGYGFDPQAVAASDITITDHTGDGATASFSMDASPATIAATNVYIDGLYQEKDTYTISGATLTFGSPPSNGASIEIVVAQSSEINGAGSQQITYDQGSTGAVQRTVKSRLQDIVSIKDFGGVCDGVTNDADALIAALGTGQEVIIPETSYISLSAGQVQTFIENLNLVSPKQITEFLLPAGDHAITQQVEITNPDARNIIIKGDVRTQVTLSAATSVGGGARAHSIQCTLSSATDVDVNDYLYIGYSAGTGNYNVVEGVWKVTAKSGSNVTVRNTLNDAWPTITVSGGRVVPLKTILRWPTSQRGLAISGCQLRGIENLVIASQFDISSGTPTDSYSDGLQVGTVSDQLNTGSFESQQTNAGAVWLTNVGVVEWEGNGVQVVGGNAYFFQAAACSNGWRGFQAARNGSIGAKYCAAIGNGASGFQAEAMGFCNANGGVAAGNWQQGVYAIGNSSVSFIGGFSLLNQTAGLDARNYGVILADTAKVDGNAVTGINSVAGNVLFGASATASNNGTGTGSSVDVNTAEGGVVNANGASGIGIIRTSTTTASVVIDTDGEQIWDNALFVETRSTGAKNSITNTSVGDLIIQSDVSGSGTYLDLLRVKGNNGTFFPDQDATSDLGRASERWSTVYAATGTINTSDETEKQDIRAATDAEMRVAQAIKSSFKMFRFKDAVAQKGDGARLHFGVIAQDVKAAFEAEGLDPTRYGIFCSDAWWVDAEGNVHDEPSDGLTEVSRFGVRYEELLAFVVAAI